MYNPYQYQTLTQPVSPYLGQRQEVVRVSGEAGAKAYPLPPSSSILLLDEQNPIIYLKTTDGGGYPTLSAYTITPYQEPSAPDFSSLEERIKKLEESLNAKSNASAARSRKSNSAGNSVSGETDNADA